MSVLPRSILAAVCCYLIGNIQTSLILSRLLFRDDVRQYGSKNAGATNMLRVFGWKYGIATFAGDLVKAVLAVFVGKWIAGLPYGRYIGALFVVIGHCWPLLFGFKGGKGVACSLGIGYVLFPLGGVIVSVFCACMFLAFRIVSLMYLSGFVLYIVLLFLFHYDPVGIVVISLITAIVFFRHRSNIIRLIRKEEKKLIP